MSSTIRDRNGGTTSSSATVERETGLATNAAIKAPCHAMATTPITLSGLQTIDGIALTRNKRVLVAGQADAAQNGIYITSTGLWKRSPDFNRNDDVMAGTLVAVMAGTANTGIWVAQCDDSPAEVDTTEITFDYFTDITGYVTIAVLASYALLASPVFTGNPRAPTPSPGDNDTSIATTAFVTAAIAALVASAPGALDTLDELAAALGDDANFATTVTNALAACLKNNVEDQTLTGGARVTSKDLGTPTNGATVTLDPGDRPLQHLTNNVAGFTLAPGSNGGSILLDITNGASAGAITVSGWTKVVGAFTTTSGHKFRCHGSIGNGGSLLTIQPLQ